MQKFQVIFLVIHSKNFNLFLTRFPISQLPLVTSHTTSQKEALMSTTLEALYAHHNGQNFISN